MYPVNKADFPNSSIFLKTVCLNQVWVESIPRVCHGQGFAVTVPQCHLRCCLCCMCFLKIEKRVDQIQVHLGEGERPDYLMGFRKYALAAGDVQYLIVSLLC